MKNTKGGRGVTLLALTAALGVAVYLNWSFAKAAPQAVQGTAESEATQQVSAEADAGAAQTVYDPLETGAVAAGASADSSAQTVDKNYGEAQLVSVNQDSSSEFFDEARLTRSKTRDQALDTLKKSLKDATLTSDEKTKLTDELSAQVTNITAESDLETQIKAKGFADCVVFLNDGKANITVMTENDALTAAEVTQIRDLVLNKMSDMKAQDITVVEVK